MFNYREPNMLVTHGEDIVVIWAILLIRSYLEGTKFTFRTDRHALKRTFNSLDATGRLEKWFFRLLEYDFHLVHRADIKHQVADSLPRPPTEKTDDSDSNDDTPIMAVTTRAQKKLDDVRISLQNRLMLRQTNHGY